MRQDVFPAASNEKASMWAPSRGERLPQEKTGRCQTFQKSRVEMASLWECRSFPVVPLEPGTYPKPEVTLPTGLFTVGILFKSGKKPAAFHTAGVTGGVQLIYLY
ncbi:MULTISPECIES: hypothetical protein [Cupriavidus]